MSAPGPAPTAAPAPAPTHLVVIPEIRQGLNGHRVRTSRSPLTGEPIYVFNDLAEGLELTNPNRTYPALDKDMKGRFSVPVDTESEDQGGDRYVLPLVTRIATVERRWVTLPGALQMIAESPLAKVPGTAAWHFRRWIFKDRAPT